MRVLLSSALLGAAALMTSTALADTFSAKSRVSAVTVYPSEALITRTAEVELPAGRHRILIGGMPFLDRVDNLQVTHPGVRRIGLYLREGFPVLEDISTPERAAAEARVAKIEDQIDALHRAASEARLAADGAEAAIAFLSQMGRGEGTALPDPEQLRALVTTIGEETAQAREIILRAAARQGEFERQLDALNADLSRAEAELAALSLEDEKRLFLALDVEAGEAMTVPLRLSYPAYAVTWQPSYEFDLQSGDAPSVLLRRDIKIQQATGEDWEDVALRVSTSTPDQSIAPSVLYPLPRRIEDPMLQKMQDQERRLSAASLAEPMAAPVMVEEADAGIAAIASDAGVSYVFSEPVTLRSGAELAYLSLPELRFDAQVGAEAVPLGDQTAYRVATLTNSSGEELLGSRNARFSLDGDLVGTADFAGLIPEAEADLGFGPIDGLRIKRDLLDQSEGGRGVISRSNQRNMTAEIEVENLSDQVWPLRVLDRVPYSQQEDLEITWSASPTPSEENVDKQRGILAWELEMQPGSTRIITLKTRLDWPDGKVLR